MLIRYLELGAERPPGALTPEEACQGVRQVSQIRRSGSESGPAHGLLRPGSLRRCAGRARARERSWKKPERSFEALGKVKTLRGAE